MLGVYETGGTIPHSKASLTSLAHHTLFPGSAASIPGSFCNLLYMPRVHSNLFLSFHFRNIRKIFRRIEYMHRHTTIIQPGQSSPVHQASSQFQPTLPLSRSNASVTSQASLSFTLSSIACNAQVPRFT